LEGWGLKAEGKLLRCTAPSAADICCGVRVQELTMANKEQKRSTREAKKPKQKKKGTDKKPTQSPASKA
jgi:hypothetical protein